MPEIKLKGLSKSYDGKVDVLKAIDLTMEDGEFTVLVGPSGCGKSTTLRLLAGLEVATGGSISVDGHDITDLEPKDRNMAMVFQNYALYPHMTVADNIGFSLKVGSVDKTEIAARVADVAAMLDISELLERRPKDLSGGQRQRVAIGRAIIKDSEIFLLDEPLSNLDAALRGDMRVELSLLHQKLKKNMVYVTHDQVEAMTLGDRIIVMSDGLIQQAGSPEEIFNSPKNKFVAGFIGNPKMNFLTATVGEDGGDLYAGGAGFKIALTRHENATIGQKTHLGIRPENISFDENGQLKMKIIVAEYVGQHKNVIAEISGAKINITAPVDQETTVGKIYGFTIDTDKVHLFDAGSGEAV